LTAKQVKIQRQGKSNKLKWTDRQPSSFNSR